MNYVKKYCKHSSNYSEALSTLSIVDISSVYRVSKELLQWRIARLSGSGL